MKTLDDVTAALEEIARCEADVAQGRMSMEESFRIAKERFLTSADPLAARAERLRAEVEEWADEHPEAFDGRRSLELSAGTVGWRKATSIRLRWAIAKIIAALRERRLSDAILVKESVNKDVLATYSDKRLADVGATRVVKDNFFIDLAATAAAVTPAK